MNKLAISGLIAIFFVSLFLSDQALASTDETWNWIAQRRISATDVLATGGLDVDEIICEHTNSVSRYGNCWIYKTFNATDVDGKNMTANWSATHTSGGHIFLNVRDGEYVNSDADFPFQTTTPTNKGNGIINDVLPQTALGGGSTTRTDIFSIDEVDATTGFVTVFFLIWDNAGASSPANSGNVRLQNFTIDDVAFWEFGTGNGSIVDTSGTGCIEGCGNYTGHGFLDLSDSTPPVITLIGQDPISVLKDFAYGDAGATCIDAIDGDVSGGIVVDSSAVDTSTLGSYQVTYDCDDTSANSATQVIRTVNVIEITVASGSGGGFASGNPSGKGGSGSGGSLSQLSDVPPLVEPTTAPTDVERAFSIFDTLNSFFEPTITERVEDVAIDVGETVASEVQERLPEPESFVDRIRNFFGGLFG